MNDKAIITNGFVIAHKYLTPAGGSRALAEIAHEEGRYTPAGGYEYYLKDHLGNVRVTLGQSGVAQWTDYDPWGWELPALSSGASTNRTKFNGQESVPEIGPGMQDFGSRLYDNTIGRWGVVDPLSEVSRRWSPFVFGYDNPLRFVDPDGMEAKTTTEYTYSDGYSTQSSRNSSASIGFSGLGAFIERGASSTNSGQTQGGDGPGRKIQPDSPNQTSSAASVAGGAISLGRAAGPSVISRILTGVGRFFASGAGLVATLPFTLVGDVTSTNDEEKPVKLYRGVHVGHSDHANALKGKAVPWGINGGHQSPEQHSGGNTKSIFTSWSLTKFEALKNATSAGSGGVVLERNFYITKEGIIPQSGAWFDDELEYLVPGVVTGAKVQVLK